LRNFILEELVGYSSVIGTDSVVPRHLMLLADFMTYRGIPTKVTYTGLQDEFEETPKAIGFERPFPTMAERVMTGQTETTLSNISSVFFGKQANIGEGFKEVFATKEYMKKLESNFSSLSADDLMNGIENFEDAGNETFDGLGADIPAGNDLPDNIGVIPINPIIPDRVENPPAGFFEGEPPREEVKLSPPIGLPAVSQGIIKDTLNRIVPIQEIYSEEEMKTIVMEPLGEEAVISQMPVEIQRQQEVVETERLAVPVPEIEPTRVTFPGLFELLEQGNQVEIPVDIGL